jgi:hypothetical protein
MIKVERFGNENRNLLRWLTRPIGIKRELLGYYAYTIPLETGNLHGAQCLVVTKLLACAFLLAIYTYA